MSSDPQYGEGDTAIQYTYPWWADETMFVAGMLSTVHSACEATSDDGAGAISFAESGDIVCWY